MSKMRYLRAFFTALRMTVRGEKFPASPYAPLIAWIQQGDALVKEVYQIADANGIDMAARQKIILRIDSRDISAETILATIRHHTSTEYLYLIRDLSQHSITAIYASNLNDRHFIERLKESIEIKNIAVKGAIERLETHLGSIPSTNKNL